MRQPFGQLQNSGGHAVRSALQTGFLSIAAENSRCGRLHILNLGMDTMTATGKLMLPVLGAVAQFLASRNLESCSSACLTFDFLAQSHLGGTSGVSDKRMIKPNKPCPAPSPLLFEIDEPLQETLAAWAVMPRRSKSSLPSCAGGVRRRIHIRQRERGYEETTMVESFAISEAAGRWGLKDMLGNAIPSTEMARKFLHKFHAEEKRRNNA